MRSGPYTGGAVLLPWDAIDLRARRNLVRARIISAENRRADARGMLGLAAACGFALVIISGGGFGQLSHPWLVQGHWFVLTYGLLLAGILVPSAWLARRIFSRHSWLPFDRALLPLDAVETTRKGLVVRPFGDARFATLKDGVFEIAYADTSTFRIRLDPAVDERQLLEAETTLERASLTNDDAYRASVDPFHDLRGEKGLRAHPRAIPIDTKASAWRARADLAAAIAMVIASFALVAFVLLPLRNRLSDDAAFDYARHENARVHYEAYLDSGGTRHAREVHDDRLPRIVLDDAKAHGSADEVAAFLDRFPRSRFDAEARAALAANCAVAGDDAVKKSTSPFEDLRHFANDHPACAPHVDGVFSRFFAAKRAALTADTEIEPAFRDMLLGMLDRAERTRQRTPFRILVTTPDARDPDGAVQWALADSMRRFVGPAIEVLAYHSVPEDSERLEITLSHEPCPPGTSARSLVAHFEIKNGPKSADWWRHIEDALGMFAAATTSYSTQTACVVDRAP